MKKQYIYILIGMIVLVIAGSAGLFIANKNKPLPQSVITQTDPAVSQSTETCSPPGTPTCGPDGRVVKSSTPGGTAQTSSSTGSLSKITDVDLKTIKLTGAAPQGLDIDQESGLAYIGNNG